MRILDRVKLVPVDLDCAPIVEERELLKRRFAADARTDHVVVGPTTCVDVVNQPGKDVATGKDYIFRAWWLVTMPGIAISITVLAVNLVASWMRLISDPQEREKQFARQMAILKKRGRRAPLPREVMGK